jgi:nucleotide-binding universal stress UspA family protein
MDLFSKILVPTDGTGLSRGAAAKAIALAKAMNAELVFLHATPEKSRSFMGGEGGAFVNQASQEDLDHESDRLATLFLGALESEAAALGVACSREVAREQAPYEAIIETATRCGCDLIVMASHGRRGIKNLILGSETQKVLTLSKIPVLVFR